MMHNYALNTYHKTLIETANPVQLVVLCYRAVLRNLKEAREFHEARSMEQAYKRIWHARDIIKELLVTLDFEQGGEIAANLNRLYRFALGRLAVVNSHTEPSLYDHLIGIFSELMEAWEQVEAGAPGLEHESRQPRNWQASV